MIDGTRIGDICVVIYYEYILKKVLRIGLYDAEGLEYIKNDLLHFKNTSKYNIRAFVNGLYFKITPFFDMTKKDCFVTCNEEVDEDVILVLESYSS